jgi:hypothetical protein
MSDATKQASTAIPLSPDESYEASQLLGRSLFSALQLAREQEMRKNQLAKKYTVEDDRVLKIPIPEHLMPSQKVAEDFDEQGAFSRAFGALNKHPMRMIVGGQTGFRDAKKEYYLQQKEQIQKELLHAQKEYIDTLSRIKTGSELETPCVDAFCNGIAYATLFGKTASQKDVDIEEGSVQRVLGDAKNTAMKQFQPATDFAANQLLRTAAGSAYLTFLLRKKLREEPDKYMDEHLPTRVELQPYV